MSQVRVSLLSSRAATRPRLKGWFLLIGVIISGVSFAQDDAALRARAAALVDSLCSPRYEGRGYVNGGDRKAADFIAAQFQRLRLRPVMAPEHGLDPGWMEPFTFDVNTFPDSINVVIDGHRLVPGLDFIVDPSSGRAQGRYDLVHLTPMDLMLPERRGMTMGVVAGHAVQLHFPATENKDTLALYAEWARDLGHYVPVLRKAHGKLTWSVAQEALPFPIIEIAAEAWPADTASTVELNVRNKLVKQHRAYNVLGMAPAKGKSKDYLVITAHYDHLGRMGPEALFPGANDNASGVAMLLALAEHMMKEPGERNVLFIAFAGEEAGLMGSKWCVVDRPIDWARVDLLINLDILGTGEEGIMVVNATEQEKVYDQLVAINERTHRLAAVKRRGPACNSDHCPFAQRDVPAIFIYTLGGISAYHDVHDVAGTLPLTEFPDIFHTLVDLITGLK